MMGAEVEDFLGATMPRLHEAEVALHNGDAGPRIAMWSHSEPVTLFGAGLGGTGWAEIGPIFEQLGSFFSNCTAYEMEIIAASASGDLAYIVAFEHTTTSLKGAPPEPYILRVTTVFRREGGEWKVAHRHGDPASESGRAMVQQLRSTSAR